jgi:YihY family inner membrane protein
VSRARNAREGSVGRLRVLAEGIARHLGGLPAVRTLVAVMAVYDRAGGGLTAAGLAYTSLIALLPLLLLMVSIFGLIVDDEAVRETLVTIVEQTVPPLEEFARTALRQVASNAVPTGVVAVLALLWGSSRFYAALDSAFSRIFHGSRRRNEIERTLRGVVTTGLLVAMPIVALVAGWIVAAVLELVASDGVADAVWRLGTPAATVVLYLVAMVAIFRFVPPQRVTRRAYLVPAVLVGCVLAVLTQVFSLLGPLLTQMAALYGTVVGFFAVLAWLSLSFNVLLVGAAWVRVRALAAAYPTAAHADPAAAGRPRATGSP